MGRLRGGVDHRGDVLAVTGEHIGKRALAADVGIDVTVAGQILSRLRRAGAVDAAHVVVDADDVETLLGESSARLGADQSSRTRNQRNAHPKTRGIFVFMI